MRGASLRIKINLAIFLAFVVAAVAFGSVLRLYIANRLASTHNRTRVLLAAVAAHRLEALVPALEHQGDMAKAQDILNRLSHVPGVLEASLFDGGGALLLHAGRLIPAPLISGAIAAKPSGRVFAVAAGHSTIYATLVDPVPGLHGPRGFLRLRYNLTPVHQFNRQLWLLFTLALSTSYLLMAGLLNALLHRFVLRPVETLRQGLEAVEDGRLDQRIPVTSRDALGRVAVAFNAMADRLRDTSVRLQASQNEVDAQQRLLETRVEQRTAELAETNARLEDEIEGRRQALAQRDAVLANTQVGLATIKDHRFLEINHRGAELLGYDRVQLLGRSTSLVFPCIEPIQETIRAFDAALDEHGSFSDEVRVRRSDGSLIWLRVHGKIVGPHGAGQPVVWAFDDITREKERQAELEQAKRQAEQASRAKGSFLAVMSHEIRTPLNAIMGLTELLLTRDAPAEQREQLRTIQDSATHLNGIINDILDFSKIEAGKLVLEQVDFNLPELLQAVTRVIDVQARKKQLQFTLQLDPEIPETLRGDPGRLRQVLLNLLGNAVKFTEKGSVVLLVRRTDPSDSSQGTVGLTVRIVDSGIGIAPDRLEGLFTNFQQGSGSIARRFGGTGLGLAISKEIVERMGGAIEVCSTEGQGSTFTFRVDFEPGDPKRVEATRPLPGMVSAARQLRILLVEDNALNAAVTRLHLGRMGHDLTIATSAAEAYAKLARERYDVVLMDIEMPDVDGIAATRAIRAGGADSAPVLDPTVPIVALTAHAVEDVRLQCLDAGMNAFVTKPINYRTLEASLEAMGGQTPAATIPPPPPLPDGKAVFDPETARTGMGITWEQYRMLTQVSFEEGTKRLEDVKAAVKAGRFDLAAIAAHTFKGVSATLGAYVCREQGVLLERLSRENDAVSALSLVEALMRQWQEVGRLLAAWQPPTEDQAPVR